MSCNRCSASSVHHCFSHTLQFTFLCCLSVITAVRTKLSCVVQSLQCVLCAPLFLAITAVFSSLLSFCNHCSAYRTKLSCVVQSLQCVLCAPLFLAITAVYISLLSFCNNCNVYMPLLFRAITAERTFPGYLSLLSKNTAVCTYLHVAHLNCSGFDIKSWGTRVGVSIIIAVLNVTLKLLVQFLGKYEMHWTLSNKVCVCVRACMHACVYVPARVCAWTCVCVPARVHVCTHVWVGECVHCHSSAQHKFTLRLRSRNLTNTIFSAFQ